MKIDLNIQELRLIEAGLDARNIHNEKIMYESRYTPKNIMERCKKESDEILDIKKKIQKAYEENPEEIIKETFGINKSNVPIEIVEENEELLKEFINGFIGIDISEKLGFNIPIIITSKSKFTGM
ncbi:MAG: hypothetical protein RR942_06015 [Romboutsia sp.]